MYFISTNTRNRSEIERGRENTKLICSSFICSIREEELHQFAKELLSAANKTESGGDAYDALELLVRHPSLSYLRPDSEAKLEPMKVEISLGPFTLEDGAYSLAHITIFNTIVVNDKSTQYNTTLLFFVSVS